MTEAISNVIVGLATPGRFLAFCDETDLTIEPTSTMVGNIHLHIAVVVPSDGYAVTTSVLAVALRTFGVSEFHAVDIVNNGKKSVWQHREKADTLLDTSTPAAVIADKENNKPGFGLATIEGGDNLSGGGLILAHSHEVLGLQLADAAAYVIGRYIRRRDRMAATVEDAGEEALDAFDRLVAATVGRLIGRVHSLLSQPVLHSQAAST